MGGSNLLFWICSMGERIFSIFVGGQTKSFAGPSSKATLIMLDFSSTVVSG
jgi:hypothetical protein